MKTGHSKPVIWPGTLVGGQKETVLAARQPSPASLRHQPEETAAVGWRKRKLVVQVGEIERGRVRDARPRNQVGALLQHKVCGRDEPGKGEVGA